MIDANRVKYYKTAIAILGNDEDVADAIQETLISIYTNINKLQNAAYFTTWSIRILINKCYDIINKNKKITYLKDKMEWEETGYSKVFEDTVDIQEVLNQIDPELRNLVILYYYDELPISEIADILEIPVGTVKSRLFNARKKLYQIMGGDEVAC